MTYDDKFAEDMAQRAEFLNDLFERIPETTWDPCLARSITSTKSALATRDLR